MLDVGRSLVLLHRAQLHTNVDALLEWGIQSDHVRELWEPEEDDRDQLLVLVDEIEQTAKLLHRLGVPEQLGLVHEQHRVLAGIPHLCKLGADLIEKLRNVVRGIIYTKLRC